MATKEMDRGVHVERAASPVVARVTEIAADGQVWIAIPGARRPQAARFVLGACGAIGAPAAGSSVLVLFEAGNRAHPIVVGEVGERVSQEREVKVEGGRIVFEAGSEITLRSGASSIVLSADGSIRIKGRDLLSRASGPHRIKGATVAIN